MGAERERESVRKRGRRGEGKLNFDVKKWLEGADVRAMTASVIVLLIVALSGALLAAVNHARASR